jgi:single-stranded DNA-binding protein
VIVETMQMMDSKADAAQSEGSPSNESYGGGYEAPAQKNSQAAAPQQGQQSYGQPKQQSYAQQNSYGNAQQQQPQSQQRQEMPQHNIPVIDIDEDEIPF